MIEPQYEDAKSFMNGLAAVCKDGLWGFIDFGNNNVIECQYLEAGYFCSSGVCSVKIQQKGEKLTDEEMDWRFIELEIGIKEN